MSWNLARSIRSTDDNDQACVLRGYAEVTRAAIRVDELKPLDDRLRAIVQGATGRTALLFGGLVGLSIAFLYGWLSRTGAPMIFIWGVTFAIALSFGAMLRFAMAKRYRAIGGPLRDAMVGDGVCAGCGYPLIGLDVDGDGMLVCPECGAAWQEDRIRRHVLTAPIPRDMTVRRALSWYVDAMSQGYSLRRSEDDRKAPVGLMSFRRVAARVKKTTGDERERCARVAAKTRWRGIVLRLVVSSIFLLQIAMAVGIIIATGLSRAIAWVFVIHALLLPFWVILIVAVVRSDLGRGRRRMVNAMLDEGLCPSCAALLPADDIEHVEDDGCVLCGRCGAAWRRVETPQPSV